jgi:hypothetical protein
MGVAIASCIRDGTFAAGTGCPAVAGLLPASLYRIESGMTDEERAGMTASLFLVTPCVTVFPPSGTSPLPSVSTSSQRSGRSLSVLPLHHTGGQKSIIVIHAVRCKWRQKWRATKEPIIEETLNGSGR